MWRPKHVVMWSKRTLNKQICQLLRTRGLLCGLVRSKLQYRLKHKHLLIAHFRVQFNRNFWLHNVGGRVKSFEQILGLFCSWMYEIPLLCKIIIWHWWEGNWCKGCIDARDAENSRECFYTWGLDQQSDLLRTQIEAIRNYRRIANSHNPQYTTRTKIFHWPLPSGGSQKCPLLPLPQSLYSWRLSQNHISPWDFLLDSYCLLCCSALSDERTGL
jgi:hypothetical protein